MTPCEILFIIRDYNRQIKEKVEEKFIAQYNQAKLIAEFVNYTMGGKKVPTLEEIMPSLSVVADKNKDFKDAHNGLSELEYKQMMMAKEQFIDFANRRNKKLKEGKTDVN